jgi:hypothetical protein
VYPALTVTIAVPIPSVWGKVGVGMYYSKAVIVTGITIIANGYTVANAQNAYWDFMQTNVIQGMTTLGRGGGTLGTGPCGWYVGYFYEAPAAGLTYSVDVSNV